MYDVITIGTATRDVFLKSPLFKVLRDSKHLKKIGVSTGEAQCFALGSKIEVESPIFTVGGGATNAAVTFSRQGLKTAALFKIGDDESAEYILKTIQKEEITSLAINDRNKKTAYSVILLAPGGERTILVYRGASEELKIQEIPFGKLTCRWAYISPGNISFPVMEKIFNFFSKNKTLIAFNPSKYFLKMGIKKIKPFLAKSKVVLLNREEAADLVGINYQKEKEIFKKLDEWVPGITIMTMGSDGVMVSDGLHIYSAGVFKDKIVDRTGAGDAFGSGFVAGLIQKGEGCKKGFCQPFNIEYAIRLGSANATSVIEHIGAKEGIITKNVFKNNSRWRSLKIKITNISK